MNGIIAKPIGLLLQWIYDLVGSYGLAIIILTVIVKGCLYPLYAMQTKSTIGMASIQPQVQAIQRKYANDPDTMNAKIQELYKEEDVHPAAGCVPMLIQMPIIFGLFNLLRHPVQFMGTEDNVLFAIHEAFWYLPDLTQPDKWILPIAAGIATFISFTMSTKLNATPDATGGTMASTGSMMKVMKYFFPIMIIWMARTYPSGLAIYWFLSQIIQIIINIRLSFVRKKLRAKKEAQRLAKHN